MRRVTARHLLMLAITSLSLINPGAAALADELPTPRRVQDLGYGQVLYAYYQDDRMAALTQLSVASARGGIRGHGDYPRLLEGGLMLSYGMPHQARQRFEQLLHDQVTPSVRNQAWFYLGKVLYLQQDNAAASDALQRVDPAVLLDDPDLSAAASADLHQEWLYLQGQLALRAGKPAAPWIDQLPADSLWRSYLLYNQAIQSGSQQPQASLTALAALASDLSAQIASLAEIAAETAVSTAAEAPEAAAPEAKAPEDSLPAPAKTPQPDSEIQSLLDRVLLTLGQLELQAGHPDKAQRQLAQIGLNSLVSDQALFNYAVAATQTKAFGLALSSLQQLEERPLFAPWLQQVPYALGFLYEQLNRKNLALTAYQKAATHYAGLAGQLASDRRQLTEASILQALQFTLPDNASGALQPGDPAIRTDAYGRLAVQPADFRLAHLLSTEAFQTGLQKLHELYALAQQLKRHAHQLEAFELMLETRAAQRKTRIAETQAALTKQQADLWRQQQKQDQQAIAQALEQQDAAFFMRDEQIKLAKRIAAAADLLKQLDDQPQLAKQRLKLQRIQAYFNWTLENQYHVNRWAAQKQLRDLNQAMAVFEARHVTLQTDLNEDPQQNQLGQRVQQAQQDLRQVHGQLDAALQSAAGQLLDQVRAELMQQERQVGDYLHASRLAQARLSDLLYQTPSESQTQTHATPANQPSDQQEAAP